MKRHFAHGLIGLTGLLLSGCPIYPNQTQCLSDSDCLSDSYCTERGFCAQGTPTPSGTGGTGGTGGTSSGTPCSSLSGCDINQVCGFDRTCHTGDCSFSGCLSPYECVLDGYLYVCSPPGSQHDSGAGGSGQPDGSAGTGGSSTGGSSTGGSSTGGSGGVPEAAAPAYCGNPADCSASEVCSPNGTCIVGSCTDHGCVPGFHCSSTSPAACIPDNSASCIADSECTALGSDYRCVTGQCTAPAEQCSDKTQCPEPTTHSCVNGKCVASCVPATQCPQGYSCNTALGLCSQPTTACTITNDCGGASIVCVDGACVPRCSDTGTCGTGFSCVANGCVPNQSPSFICGADGQQDVCASGSICLHHSCYISCASVVDACDALPPELNVCKSVSTSSGGHQVCGSSSNLGSECDPTAALSCSNAKICIDGFCR